jgi:hypothetical protein
MADATGWSTALPAIGTLFAIGSGIYGIVRARAADNGHTRAMILSHDSAISQHNEDIKALKSTTSEHQSALAAIAQNSASAEAASRRHDDKLDTLTTLVGRLEGAQDERRHSR